jgi:hypothetical protein
MHRSVAALAVPPCPCTSRAASPLVISSETASSVAVKPAALARGKRGWLGACAACAMSTISTSTRALRC